MPALGALALTVLTGAALPENDWSRVRHPSAGPAQAIGGVAHGCLAGAERLPDDGPGYEAIRLSRRRDFGHPALIAFIRRLGAKAQAAGLTPFYVGDMAQPRGGPLPYGHASHQTGIDVDIWFALDPKPPVPPATRETLDLPTMLAASRRAIDPQRFDERQVTLLRLAASDPAVDRIFVNPAIKVALCEGIGGARAGDHDWLHRIRPWWGHDDHFHVRLACPRDSPECQSQPPVPPGDGCDESLAWWLDRTAAAAPSPVAPHPRRRVTLPSACRALLAQP